MSSDFLNEIKGLERTITADIKSYKSNMTGNTSKIEQSIRKNLESYHNSITQLGNEYKTNKSGLPEKEYLRRVNEIQTYKQLYQTLFSDYDNNLRDKYGYVI